METIRHRTVRAGTQPYEETAENMGSSALKEYDERPVFAKLPLQANCSYLTDDTEATSFSEDGDEHEVSLQYYGACRIDDFVFGDEKDSMFVASMQSSLNDLDEGIRSEGLPQEIMVIEEDKGSICDEEIDVHDRLKIAETLAQTYKAKIHSTEELTDCLHDYLKQAQAFAEDVLADRNELLQQVQDMQEEEQIRMDQSVPLKVILASSLFYYACGGSPIFLACSVGLSLLFDAVNAFL